MKFEENDVEKAKEVGFKILDIQDDGYQFKVTVQIPDANLTKQVFSFNNSYREEVEYVEDGEIKKKPKWKKKIEEKLSNKLEKMGAVQTQQGSDDLSKHVGEKLDIK